MFRCLEDTLDTVPEEPAVDGVARDRRASSAERQIGAPASKDTSARGEFSRFYDDRRAGSCSVKGRQRCADP